MNLCRAEHRDYWYITAYRCSHQHGRYTTSKSSQVTCAKCGRVWRTVAQYVDNLPLVRPTVLRLTRPEVEQVGAIVVESASKPRSGTLRSTPIPTTERTSGKSDWDIERGRASLALA